MRWNVVQPAGTESGPSNEKSFAWTVAVCVAGSKAFAALGFADWATAALSLAASFWLHAQSAIVASVRAIGRYIGPRWALREQGGPTRCILNRRMSTCGDSGLGLRSEEHTS